MDLGRRKRVWKDAFRQSDLATNEGIKLELSADAMSLDILKITNLGSLTRDNLGSKVLGVNHFFVSRDLGKITRDTWDVFYNKGILCSSIFGSKILDQTHRPRIKIIQGLHHFYMNKLKLSMEIKFYIVLKIMLLLSHLRLIWRQLFLLVYRLRNQTC